jgi:hypothetical protein
MPNIKIRVWWIPQVPGEPFYVPVPDLATGKLLCDVLADYDNFQFENNIKPDYSNVGGIEYHYGDGDWEGVDPDDEDEMADVQRRIEG